MWKYVMKVLIFKIFAVYMAKVLNIGLRRIQFCTFVCILILNSLDDWYQKEIDRVMRFRVIISGEEIDN